MAENENKTMTITVKTHNREYKAVLREPLFDEFRMAAMALQSKSGVLDTLAAGRQLLKLCWVDGDEQLKNADTSKDPDLHKAFVSACMDAYNELFNVYDSEVKKN